MPATTDSAILHKNIRQPDHTKTTIKPKAIKSENGVTKKEELNGKALDHHTDVKTENGLQNGNKTDKSSDSDSDSDSDSSSCSCSSCKENSSGSSSSDSDSGTSSSSTSGSSSSSCSCSDCAGNSDSESDSSSSASDSGGSSSSCSCSDCMKDESDSDSDSDSESSSGSSSSCSCSDCMEDSSEDEKAKKQVKRKHPVETAPSKKPKKEQAKPKARPAKESGKAVKKPLPTTSTKPKKRSNGHLEPSKPKRNKPDLPPKFKLLKKNVFIDRKPVDLPEDEIPVCICKPGTSGPGCGEGCINRVMYIECTPGYCPMGDSCTNQRLQKRQFSLVEPIKTALKGWGLRAGQDIKKGQFVIEYVGEVISNVTCTERLLSHKKATNFYFLTLNSTECLDASHRGNLARFINHSCDPNCETQKWMVLGEMRIGIFARTDIKKGDEITFDYQFQRIGAKKQQCHCNAANCRGFLGNPPKKKHRKPSKGKKGKKPWLDPKPQVDAVVKLKHHLQDNRATLNRIARLKKRGLHLLNNQRRLKSSGSYSASVVRSAPLKLPGTSTGTTVRGGKVFLGRTVRKVAVSRVTLYRCIAQAARNI